MDGRTITKPGADVQPGATVETVSSGQRWVSRGAEKLVAALDAFGFDPSARTALDIGASTGGFTEVLLARGARRVYAVDVGQGQLHAQIAADPRVVALERTDARRLDRALIPEPVEALVADVSFISLTKALPAALALAAAGAWLVVLIKPQFEAGPEHVGRNGLVRDATVHARVIEIIIAWLGRQPGWHVVDQMTSPITGGSGNVEFLVGARHE